MSETLDDIALWRAALLQARLNLSNAIKARAATDHRDNQAYARAKQREESARREVYTIDLAFREGTPYLIWKLTR